MSSPKQRPFELQRQRRLIDLYTWGKANIPPEELFELVALHRLTNKAIADFGVTYVTGSNYAKVVLFKLRQENGHTK